MRGSIAALLIVTWCGACGGDDGGGGGPVTIDELPDAYLGVLCDRVMECSVLGALIYSQTTCDTFAYEFRNDGVAQIQQGIDDGTIVYDADAMGRCLEAIATAPCEQLSLEQLSDLPGCEGAIVGQQGDGDACSNDGQCGPGLYCDVALACPGACTARLASGEDCSNDEVCATGLRCDSANLCASPLTTGDDCTGFSCALGYQCSATTDTCVPLTHDAADGASCDPNEGILCAGQLVCAAEAADAFVCRPKAAVGGECYVAIPNQCPPDVACSATDSGVAGTCDALPEAGEPCLAGAGLFVLACAGGAVCDDVSGDCVARVENGGACTLDVECANACAVTCQEPVACP